MKFLIFTLATIAVVSATIPVSRLDDRTFWEGLLGALLTPIGDALQTSAELAAQLTAAISVGGIDAVLALFNGKRNADTRILDLLTGIATDYFNNVISPAVTDAAQNLALLAAQLVAGVAEGGLPALTNLLSGIGKRSVDPRFLDLLSGIATDYFNNIISPALTDAAQNLALLAAQLVAGVAEGGLPALTNLLG